MKKVIIVKIEWIIPSWNTWAIQNVKTKVYLRDGYNSKREAVKDAKKRGYEVVLYRLTGE